jgi:hypothetical protein
VSVQCLLHGLGAADGIPIVVRDSRNCSMSFSDEKATIVEKLIQQVQNETFILDAEKILGPSILHSIPELRKSHFHCSSSSLHRQEEEGQRICQIL